MDNSINWLPIAIIFFILYCSSLGGYQGKDLAQKAQALVKAQLLQRNRKAEKGTQPLSAEEAEISDVLLNHTTFANVGRSIMLIVDKPVSKDEARKLGYEAFLHSGKTVKELVHVQVTDSSGNDLAEVWRGDLPEEYYRHTT